MSELIGPAIGLASSVVPLIIKAFKKKKKPTPTPPSTGQGINKRRKHKKTKSKKAFGIKKKHKK